MYMSMQRRYCPCTLVHVCTTEGHLCPYDHIILATEFPPKEYYVHVHCMYMYMYMYTCMCVHILSVGGSSRDGL